jgi:hypothetical protein
MSNALAIIIGAAAIAAAILIVFRWQFVSPGVLLDRWTGEVILCDPITRICNPISRKGPPAKANCEP